MFTLLPQRLRFSIHPHVTVKLQKYTCQLKATLSFCLRGRWGGEGLSVLFLVEVDVTFTSSICGSPGRRERRVSYADSTRWQNQSQQSTLNARASCHPHAQAPLSITPLAFGSSETCGSQIYSLTFGAWLNHVHVRLMINTWHSEPMLVSDQRSKGHIYRSFGTQMSNPCIRLLICFSTHMGHMYFSWHRFSWLATVTLCRLKMWVVVFLLPFSCCSCVHRSLVILLIMTVFACLLCVLAEYLRGNVLPAEQHVASDLPRIFHPNSHLKALT